MDIYKKIKDWIKNVDFTYSKKKNEFLNSDEKYSQQKSFLYYILIKNHKNEF